MSGMSSRPVVWVLSGAPSDPARIWYGSSVRINPAAGGTTDVPGLFSTDIGIIGIPIQGLQGLV